MSDAGAPLVITDSINNSALRNFCGVVGEIARPAAIIMASVSFCYAVLDEHVDVGKLSVAATLLATLYGAKVAEKMVQARADADVQKTAAKG